MNKVIETLYCGSIRPNDTIVEDNHYYKKLLKRTRQNRDRLSETLNTEMKAVPKKYDDNINKMHSTAEMETFRHVVRFGIRPMMEPGGSLSAQRLIQQQKTAVSNAGAAINILHMHFSDCHILESVNNPTGITENAKAGTMIPRHKNRL